MQKDWRVKITFKINLDHFVRFRKDEFDQILYKLDSTEYAGSFEQNPTLP